MILALAALAALLAAPPQPRVRVSLDDAWRYAAGTNTGAEAPAFDDSQWQSVTLPHTWNAKDALQESEAYRRGVGWYRRHLTVERALAGRRLFLCFEGANQETIVYVNGVRAGAHDGGYTAFTIEITDLVRLDAPNVIAVRVDNAANPDIPPLNADFTFYGGIYRDVWLVATAPVHIDMMDHASPGVYVDTPSISDTQATVRVRGTVVDQSPAGGAVRIATRLLDPHGREVLRLDTTLTVGAGASAPFAQMTPAIPHPTLWSPETPARYHLVVEVSQGRRVVDRVTVPLGFRWFAIDAQRGFALNGHPYRLYGAARHQDEGGFGNALTATMQRSDMRLIKETGFNFVRLAHYPQAPVVLDAADSLGLIVWEEIPIVNGISPSSAFAANAERMLVEMIRQHYDHPAIAFWGYMNEVDDPAHASQVLALAKTLDHRAHLEDSHRATGMAITWRMVNAYTGLANVPDVTGLNLYFGWYYETPYALASVLDTFHGQHPARPVVVTEYGAGGDERIHSFAPVRFDFSAEYEQRCHEITFPIIQARPWLIGSTVWAMFDFSSKTREDSRENVNNKGLFTFEHAPKDVASYYRAMLAPRPVLAIASRGWRHRGGPVVQPVTVYSNRDSAELFVDETSLGWRHFRNATARWSVPLHAGTNRLRAVSGAFVDTVTVGFESVDEDPAVSAGNYQYTDAEGILWDADQGYMGGAIHESHHRIAGTDDNGLYQTTREGSDGYRFAVPDGTYTVDLRFAETDTNPRVFDVLVNDGLVFDHLDLATQFGRYRAVRRRVTTTARGGHGVVVRLVAHVGATTISGIRIAPTPPTE